MKSITLETLTPVILDEEQKEKLNYKNYKEILDTIMNTNGFCNVALTGPYGAGKSSIINTYVQENDLSTIHISLANLNGEETDNVQAKLINQIIHQIDPRVIPQTQFKIKNVVGKMKVLAISILLFLFVASCIYLFNVPRTQLVSNSEVSLYEVFWMYNENKAILLIALLSFFALLTLIVNAQLKRPLIKSIHVDKSQIELVEMDTQKDNEKEKFDKYMDEIIYLFENSGIDALIIEDLDRMDDVKIFYELRQINYLLNKRLEKKRKKKVIKFVYMVRDELFKESEERTKFFDIIVPIVPVMDNSNSYDLLKKMMGEEWLTLLDESYLKTICLYIRDYRILKNIFNEFQVYYKQLRIEEYQYEEMKLFAMVTYKNLWPTDFAELQQGKGKVYCALKEIENIRNSQIAGLGDEIEGLSNEIKKIREELVHSIDELDALYFNEGIGLNNMTQGYYILDGKGEHSFNTRTEFIHALKHAQTILWYRSNYNSPIEISKERIKTEFEKLNLNEEYVARKGRVEEFCQNGTERLQHEISRKRDEQEEIKRLGFKDLLAGGITDEFLSCFNDKELIKIFVQDEMIADDYSSYMTYFYPYSITNEELRYLNKVYARDNDDEQAYIKIEHPDLVVGYLKEGDWESVALPNITLYRSLINRGGENLSKAIKNLSKYCNVEFVIQMIEKLEGNKELRVWANTLLDEWDEFIDAMIYSDFADKKVVTSILFKMLEVLDEDKIPLESIHIFLKNIEGQLNKECTLDMIKVLKKVHYKFCDISQVANSVWEDIYASDLYQVSKVNIELILLCYYAVSDSEDIIKKNYATIMSRDDQPLKKYIQASLETYVRDVYIPFYAEHSEELEEMLYFLNSEELSVDIRAQLVSKMSVIIGKIDDVSDVFIRKEIVKNKKMAFTNTNVISIWSDSEMVSGELYGYLKEKYACGKCQLSFAFAKKYFNETAEQHPKASEFVKQLLQLEGLEKGYKNLVEDVNVRYTALTSIPWTKEQLLTIVKTTIIDMTEKNLITMRKLEDEGLFFLWLCNKVHWYLKLMEKEELRDNDELKKLISIKEVDDSYKVSCIRICTEKIHVLDKYNTRVVEAIFENDLFDGDFVPIIHRYNAKRYGKQFMRRLGDYMVTYITSIMNTRFPIPMELLLYIMKSDSVTLQNKKCVLAIQGLYHSLDEIKECLSLCGAIEFLGAFYGQNPKVEASEANRVLIETLVKRKWVSSFKAVGEHYTIYPKKALFKKENA